MAKMIILVTGANRGLGYCIVSVAARRDPSAHYILACRNADEGAKAVERLKTDGISASLELLQLDVTDDEQILKAVDAVTKAHGKLDVLVNNAGVSTSPADQSLPALRAAYATVFDVNVASLACVSAGFKPLLTRAPHPKVINVTSGLAGLTNCLVRKGFRSPLYGPSKTAVNSVTVNLQAAENDLHDGAEVGVSKIDYLIAAPGFLKTAFTGWHERGKDPMLGAEVVARLIGDDSYPGGTQWEFEDGRMQQVPW